VPLGTIAVVGGSLAGLRAVEALRRHGFDGRIEWIGAERHEPYDRPPLSKHVLRGEWGPERIVLARNGLAELRAELHFGVRAKRLDAAARRIELEDGAEVAYDGLLVATGAAARRLPGQPDLDGVFLLRTIDDALAIRAALERSPRVCVVGGGFIGAEVAASCRERGLDVTMVEALGNPLEQALGPEIGALFAGIHRDRGVALRTGVAVAAIEGGTRVEHVRLADGSAVAADVVIVGIGVRPETAWLEGSGVELRDGVVCDEHCATALPNVVAAGDVARFWNARYGEEMRVEHWTHAVEQAEAAVTTLLHGKSAGAPYAPVPYVWSDQYDAKLAIAGRPRAGDEMRVVDGSFADRKFVAIFGRDGRLTGAIGLNRMRKLMDWRKALHDDLSWKEAVTRAEQ
jgi:3-phenylpropionate/trans-cinnamate dioxygenase ferredoxin reductase component